MCDCFAIFPLNETTECAQLHCFPMMSNPLIMLSTYLNYSPKYKTAPHSHVIEPLEAFSHYSLLTIYYSRTGHHRGVRRLGTCDLSGKSKREHWHCFDNLSSLDYNIVVWQNEKMNEKRKCNWSLNRWRTGEDFSPPPTGWPVPSSPRRLAPFTLQICLPSRHRGEEGMISWGRKDNRPHLTASKTVRSQPTRVSDWPMTAWAVSLAPGQTKSLTRRSPSRPAPSSFPLFAKIKKKLKKREKNRKKIFTIMIHHNNERKPTRSSLKCECVRACVCMRVQKKKKKPATGLEHINQREEPYLTECSSHPSSCRLDVMR